MKKNSVKYLFLLAILLVFSTSARAWDDSGHKLTGYIAWQTMSTDVREKVIKILRSAPEDSDLSALYPTGSRSEAAKNLEFFMIATYWADMVRDRDFKVRNEKYHHSNWHYSDTFWTQENGQVKIVPNPAGEEGGKAVEKLFEFEKVLKDANASNADKAIAIAWILHLGGDIHQPLHTSARITEFEPKGDQGGNLFLLTPKETPRNQQQNLHWFWDSIVGRNVARKNDACDADYLAPIGRQMMKKHPFAKMQNQLSLEKFDVWQQESFKVATTELFPPTLIRFQMPTESYKKSAYRIAQQQIALAGYRLGATFNQIFASRNVSQITRDEYEKNRFEYEKNKGDSQIGQGKDDSWLWFKTRSALVATEDLRDSTISVDVANSIITLRGTVGSRAQKEKAERAAKQIEGAKAVRNELKISR